MAGDKPFFPYSGEYERSIVDEMIRDQHSRNWEECSQFVKRSVYANAKNIPHDLHDEIAQEAMYKVTKSLVHFRFECSFKTWVNLIIERCIIDAHRRLQKEASYHFSLIVSPNESDYEGEEPARRVDKSAEDTFMIEAEINDGTSALFEYANAHSNPIRDRLIIRMVIFEGHTRLEAAIAVGCNAPVVSYVVREAQRYAREKMGHYL